MVKRRLCLKNKMITAGAQRCAGYGFQNFSIRYAIAAGHSCKLIIPEDWQFATFFKDKKKGVFCEPPPCLCLFFVQQRVNYRRVTAKPLQRRWHGAPPHTGAMFSIRKRGFFRHGKEIKGLRGGVQKYAAQASPQIDTARTEKDRFRTKTS